MTKNLTPPREWIGACEAQWVALDATMTDDGFIPGFELDPVDPHSSRDLRDNYRLCSQTGEPMIRACKTGDQMFLWRPDVARWQEYQRNVSLGEIECGTLRTE